MPRKPVIVLVALHLEEGPEAVPLGAACVAAALKAAFGEQGIAVRLMEGFAAKDPGPLITKILRAEADAVGFSLYSWNRKRSLEIASRLRSSLPGVFLFCGGPEAGALPQGLPVKDGGPFDALVSGEGEWKTVHLMEEHFGLDTGPAAGETVLWGDDLARLPSPWLDGTLSAGEDRGVLWELTRGCPYACAYCYESKGDRRLRRFPEERLREELRLFIRRQVPSVSVLDPTFNIEEDRALRILDLILEEGGGAGPHWHFEMRAELVSRALAKRLARLNASVQIGLQTADPSVSAQAGRFLDIDAFRRGIDFLNREGVVFGLDLIYGLPLDRLSGFKKSLDFALSLGPNHLDIFRLSLLPGTVLAGWADNLGLKAAKDAPYGIESTPRFSREDLEKAEDLAWITGLFYNRGRAVAWFRAALRPLGVRPSSFLEGFSAFLQERGLGAAQTGQFGSRKIEELQLEWLEHCYKKAGQGRLFPALREIVREQGNWGRSLAGDR